MRQFQHCMRDAWQTQFLKKNRHRIGLGRKWRHFFFRKAVLPHLRDSKACCRIYMAQNKMRIKINALNANAHRNNAHICG